MSATARPTVYRPTGTVHYVTGSSSLGAVLVAASAHGICAILLGDREDDLVHELHRRCPGAVSAAGDPRLEDLRERAVRVVDGTASGDVRLDPVGTEFERRVWAAVAEVPEGEVVTYRELAGRLGNSRSVRAVARACAANAIAVAIPCHRVVRSDGGLAGYRWGLERKRALLAREGAAA